MRGLVTLPMVALALASCATAEIARFDAKPGQEAIVRDGQAAIVSKKPGSIVMVRSASREMQSGARPVYVVAAFNPQKKPVTLETGKIGVMQLKDGEPKRDLKVMSYDELVQEEKNRQIAAAIFVGLAAGANAAAASRAGHYSAHGTAYGPRGATSFTVSGYDPGLAAAANARASMQNAAMIDNAIETGRQNLGTLEQSVLKDNTIMPGEWYGGTITFIPFDGDDSKQYRISVPLGNDVHEIDVSQVALQKS